MALSDDLRGESQTVDDGPFRGWRTWVLDNPFNTHTGPFYWRSEKKGSVICAFLPEDKNMNDVSLHGGAMMTFADAAAGMVTFFATGGRVGVVTVAFNSEFLGAGVAGAPVYATGRVVRETASMAFVQGQLDQNSQPILAFSSVMKKLTPR
jgi:uncharacterized protein (TIGR00369 family)